MLKTLDLHGMRHEDARREVIHFIEDNWNTDNELEIITGNSTKMREVVLNITAEYKISSDIGKVYDRHRITIFMGE
ncbi:Smr/MutS family protein [Candidatus Pacearchaeota archaeon]|nr:Smr/MutS family protein [Candidatus Pacearchaeota archaeon]